MNDLTFNILKLVISVVTTLLAVYIIPYLKNVMANDKYNQLLAMVEVAVRAAEQTIGTGHGSVKKDEVIEFVTKWMADSGIKISEEQLSQLIEAAVFNMNLEIK